MSEGAKLKVRDLRGLIAAVESLIDRVDELTDALHHEVLERASLGAEVRVMREALEVARKKGTLPPAPPDLPEPRFRPGRRPALMRAAGKGHDPER